MLLDNGRTSALADKVGPPGTALHPLLGVPERVPGLRAGRRPRLRLPYPGPIGAILSPQLRGITDPVDASLPYASTLCGACYDVCPVAINIPEALVYLRGKVVDAKRGHTSRRTGGVLRRRTGTPLAPAAGRRPASRLPRRTADVPFGPDPAPAAAAQRLDRHPGRSHPAAGVVPRLVGPDPGEPPMSTARDQILARVRAATRARRQPSRSRCRRPRRNCPAAEAPAADAAEAAAADAAYAELPRDYLRAHHDPGVSDITELFAERAADYRAVVERVPAAGLAAAVARILAARTAETPGPILIPAGLPAAWLAELPADVPQAGDDPPLSAAELDQTWQAPSPAARPPSPRPARSSWITARARAAAR